MEILPNTPENYRTQVLTALQNNDKYLLRVLKEGKGAKRLVFINTLNGLKKYEEKPDPKDCLIYSQIVSDKLEEEWIMNVIKGQPAFAANSRLTAQEIRDIYQKFLDRIT